VRCSKEDCLIEVCLLCLLVILVFFDVLNDELVSRRKSVSYLSYPHCHTEFERNRVIGHVEMSDMELVSAR
jgi:hypothetical protein